MAVTCRYCCLSLSSDLLQLWQKAIAPCWIVCYSYLLVRFTFTK